MNCIQIEGTQLEVLHVGNAPSSSRNEPAMVFLHEGLGSVSMWPQRGRHWPEELCRSTGRHGWLYSRRGYGQSDPIPDVREPSRQRGFWREGRHLADYMHVEAWEVLPRVLETLGIHRPILVGHSDGATIALLHAARFEVAACIVMAPHLFIEDMTLQAIGQARDNYLQSADDPKGLRARLSRYHADVDNAFWQWNDVWLSAPFSHFDIRPICQDIRSPLLAIQGLDDEYGSLEQLHELQVAAPHARLAPIQDCGHSPHRDQPEALTKVVTEFMQDIT